jgi:hypothetical protein
MGFEVHHAADGTRDIYRRGRPVGRIRGRLIELHGFWGRAEAERAVTTVSIALDRWQTWQRKEPRWKGRPVITPRSWDIGIQTVEISAPSGASADQVLQIARLATHAAFPGGTRFARSRAAAMEKTERRAG